MQQKEDRNIILFCGMGVYVYQKENYSKKNEKYNILFSVQREMILDITHLPPPCGSIFWVVKKNE